MVPRSIRRQLNRLRRRERLLRLAWTAARCLAVFAVVLAAACLCDFIVDLYRDTPSWLHVGLLGAQAALWSTGCLFVLRVLFRRLRDNEVALWVEEKMPELGHRLISAVQLNRPGAATAGMSPAMIAAVTRQAEEHADVADFARIADARRLKWSARLLAPLALVAVLLFLLWPQTVRALLERQLLADRAIPRSLAIENVSAHQVWPAGEENVLRFRVRGAFSQTLRGEVRLDGPDFGSERHELLFDSQDESGAATFIARVPPSSHDFTYRAWLKDGRTREPGEVHFEPRPIVRRQQAWVQLPAYIGLKSSGQPFEEAQKGGDIIYHLAGSAARVAVETQKPIVKAAIEVLGPPHAFAEPARPGARVETVRRSVDLTVGEGGCIAEGVFSFQSGIRPDVLTTLAAGWGAGCPVSLPWAALALVARGEPLQAETAYRIVVRDEFGLENSDKPRRGIRMAPVDPPQVALLPETLARDARAMTDEDEIEGIPILLGQRVPLAYECKAAYGLSRARLRYRVIPRNASRDQEAEPREDEFMPLPLGAATGQNGRPNPKAREEFFTRPAGDPDALDGTEGGGRFDFDSGGIPDGKGSLQRLQEGDRIQFYVEVFGRADPDGTPGRSPMREKEVVNLKDFWAWIEKKENHKERIRQLEEKQRGIAGSTSLLPVEKPYAARERPAPGEHPDAAAGGEYILGRGWQLLGPFPNDKDAGHTRAFPPEKGPIKLLDLSSQYDGLKGKIRWRKHHSETDKVDLENFFDHGEAGVAYALCWVKSAKRMKATLATGSDDGIKVWINRKLVLDKAVHREAVPADDKTPVTLDGEWQEILVKVDNRFGTWAFYFDLLDEAGEPLRGRHLLVRLAPPSGGSRFVKDWLILGPFGRPQEPNHEKVFAPERHPVDPQREYDGRLGKVRWKTYHSPDDEINLLRGLPLRFELSRSAVAYAACWVRSGRKRQAILATGSDDSIKVWINRNLELDKAVQREAQPGSDLTPIELASGWNEILVKIYNEADAWSFYLELRDPETEGGPLLGVEYRLTPPDKNR